MRPADTFLSRYIKRYYFERFDDDIVIPTDINMREFGYRTIHGDIVRHIQLATPADLRVLLLQCVPADVYVSNARYMLPDMPMQEKVWQDADIIFDIDAKDIGLECRPYHTVSICHTCKHVQAGLADKCSKCGGITKISSLTCKKCIQAAGRQAISLLDIIHHDFGDIIGQAYFSGNDGYHIHIQSDALSGIGRAGRADIADYVAARGIIHDTLISSKKSEHGWRGRFAKAAGSDRKLISREHKANIHTTMKTIISGLGIDIDPAVTMDIHRIFRMPGTINSKSGMIKASCDDIKSFDPYTSAVIPCDDMVHVRASCPIPFTLMGRRFGPYTNEHVQVPASVAAYMICKGVATL